MATPGGFFVFLDARSRPPRYPSLSIPYRRQRGSSPSNTRFPGYCSRLFRLKADNRTKIRSGTCSSWAADVGTLGVDDGREAHDHTVTDFGRSGGEWMGLTFRIQTGDGRIGGLVGSRWRIDEGKPMAARSPVARHHETKLQGRVWARNLGMPSHCKSTSPFFGRVAGQLIHQ